MKDREIQDKHCFLLHTFEESIVIFESNPFGIIGRQLILGFSQIFN